MTHIRFRLLRLIRTALESKSEFSFVADDFPLELRVLANMLPLWGGDTSSKKKTLQGFKAQLRILVAQAHNLHKLSLLYNAWRARRTFELLPLAKVGRANKEAVDIL